MQRWGCSRGCKGRAGRVRSEETRLGRRARASAAPPRPSSLRRDDPRPPLLLAPISSGPPPVPPGSGAAPRAPTAPVLRLAPRSGGKTGQVRGGGAGRPPRGISVPRARAAQLRAAHGCLASGSIRSPACGSHGCWSPQPSRARGPPAPGGHRAAQPGDSSARGHDLATARGQVVRGHCQRTGGHVAPRMSVTLPRGLSARRPSQKRVKVEVAAAERAGRGASLPFIFSLSK